VSRLKVGDRVRRISNGEQRQVSDIDMSDGTFYSSAENLWYFQHDFELVSPPHPAESPDDWVTQDVVRARPEIDQRAYQYDTDPEAGLQWDMAGQMKWDPMPMHGERGNGLTVHLRCRRRDYPQKPVEVHSGEPYVARSEYERVCLERDKLQDDQKTLLADLKDIEQTVIHLNKRVFVNNPNGWPLVPVDPECIPEGHRAVEVTRNTGGKLVVSPKRTIFMYNREHDWPRLVVEPIPTPQSPDALPRPEFPVWIRAGWWVAMDPDSVFWVFEYEPKVDEQCGEYTSRGKCVLLSDDQLTPSMRAVPVDRWRKAKWQIE